MALAIAAPTIAEHNIHDHSHVTLHELLSQPAIPPMMMAAIQPTPASPMARLLEKAHIAPDERLTIDLYQREAL